MSIWSILPEAGQPESVLFSSSHGPVTRADIERRGRKRQQELSAAQAGHVLPHSHDPPSFLVDLLACWAERCAVVLEASGRRSRGDAPGRPAQTLALTLPLRLDGDQVLLDLYTSGTTGRPERHAKTAEQLLAEARVLGPLLELGPNCVVLSTVPLHHLYGLLFGLLAPLAAGACIVSDAAGDPGQFHPHRIARAVEEHGVTHLITIPAHIRSLLDAEARLAGVREVVSSAAPLPTEWAQGLEQLSGARVIDVLGSTESGGIALRRTAREANYRPLPGVMVTVVGDGQLEIVSPFVGRSGKLCTGDRVRLEADGTFVHLGREDGVVKVGGKRFSLSELEAAVLAIPGVSDALALARPTTRSRGSEICLVVAAAGLDRGAVRRALASRVDPLLMPRRLCVLPQLPRDARGKLPRALIEHYLLLPGFELLGLALSPFRLELRLRNDSRRLEGHFPGAPVLPAVAQLLDLVVPEVERRSGAKVVAARRLKWQAPVLPGDVIVLSIDAVEPGPGKYRFRLASPTDAVISSGLLDTAV